MVPKPLHPSKIKPLPVSVGIYEGEGGARDAADDGERISDMRIVFAVAALLVLVCLGIGWLA